MTGFRGELDHFAIAVSDLGRSDAFYTDVLGAEIVDLPRGLRAYRFGERHVSVHSPGTTPSPPLTNPLAPGDGHFCLVWPGLIEEAVAHLERHGVPLVEGPVERHGACGQGRSVYFRDPDGTLLELISYDG